MLTPVNQSVRPCSHQSISQSGHAHTSQSVSQAMLTPVSQAMLIPISQSVRPCSHQSVSQAMLTPVSQAMLTPIRPCSHQSIRPCSHQSIRPCSHQSVRPCSHQQQTDFSRYPEYLPPHPQCPPSHSTHSCVGCQSITPRAFLQSTHSRLGCHVQHRIQWLFHFLSAVLPAVPPFQRNTAGQGSKSGLQVIAECIMRFAWGKNDCALPVSFCRLCVCVCVCVCVCTCMRACV